MASHLPAFTSECPGVDVRYVLLTIASGMVPLFQLKDTKVVLSLATLFLWLIVALTAATFQAL